MFYYAIDATTATLVAAAFTVTGSFIVTLYTGHVDRKRIQETRRREDEALRLAFYSDMGLIFLVLTQRLWRFKNKIQDEAAYWSWQQARDFLSEGINFDFYEHTRNESPAFYRLPDASRIDRFYRHVQALFKRVALYETWAEKYKDNPRSSPNVLLMRLLKDDFPNELKIAIEEIKGRDRDLLDKAFDTWQHTTSGDSDKGSIETALQPYLNKVSKTPDI